MIARPLAVSSLTLRQRISATRLRTQGLRVVMRLPEGSGVVRFAVYRAKNTKRTGRAPAIGSRVPARSGVYRLVLRDRAPRKLKRGSYVPQVRPGRSRSDLGTTASARFAVTRYAPAAPEGSRCRGRALLGPRLAITSEPASMHELAGKRCAVCPVRRRPSR